MDLLGRDIGSYIHSLIGIFYKFAPSPFCDVTMLCWGNTDRECSYFLTRQPNRHHMSRYGIPYFLIHSLGKVSGGPNYDVRCSTSVPGHPMALNKNGKLSSPYTHTDAYTYARTHARTHADTLTPTDGTVKRFSHTVGRVQSNRTLQKRLRLSYVPCL